MKQIHTAVIMAAGLGTRFGQMTEKMPKGFVPFKGKKMVQLNYLLQLVILLQLRKL